MIIQNKKALRRFTYICLSLSSILLSLETQAKACFFDDFDEEQKTAAHPVSSKTSKDEFKKGTLGYNFRNLIEYCDDKDQTINEKERKVKMALKSNKKEKDKSPIDKFFDVLSEFI